jgi:hypothetical protein
MMMVMLESAVKNNTGYQEVDYLLSVRPRAKYACSLKSKQEEAKSCHE